MVKWADYCISAVRFNNEHTHIDTVRKHTDGDSTIGDGTEVSRRIVISDLKRGVTYVTIFKEQNGKWQKGQKVYIVTVNGTEYIKTVEDRTTKDNLDNLPEF